jgi:16S rRNA (guanine(966)-N(2))-methyltransferase RsmD
MRVIAGSLRGRVLAAPVGLETRPTADRLRETLFNVLTQGARDRVAGMGFLDLYAGSGAVGIEAASRGASQVVFVEEGAAALAVLRRNLAGLGLGMRSQGSGAVRVEKRAVQRYLRGAEEAFGVIFLDPPYEEAEEYAGTLGLLGGACAGLVAEGGWVVAEHRRKRPLEERYGRLRRFRVKEQGDAGLSFYEVAETTL